MLHIFICRNNKIFYADQRGITQEVSLVTKHGVETKSYDTVSKFLNSFNYTVSI